MSVESDGKAECERDCKGLCTCRSRKLLSEIQSLIGKPKQRNIFGFRWRK